MRKTFSEIVEKGRYRTGPLASVPGDSWGAFRLTSKPTGTRLHVIVGSGELWQIENAEGKIPGLGSEPWEHVSVSAPNHCPLWEDMCFVKDLFFEEEELVVQYHPPKSEYVNKHPYVLHLWKPVNLVIPMPPKICV